MRLTFLRSALLLMIIMGAIVPYAAFAPFVTQHGLDIPLLLQQAIATRVSTFAWLDVIITALTILIFVFKSNVLTSKQTVLVALLTCFTGPSAGLPLLLFFLLGSPIATPQAARN